MNRALLGCAMLVLLLTACTSWHKAATDPDVSGQDIVYLRDERADLCYAVLFINKPGEIVRAMGMTAVPCASLAGVPTR